MLIIGLSGPAGVGKTTIANEMSCHYSLVRSCTILSFADPLKEMLVTLTRYAEPANPKPHTYVKDSKNTPLDWAGGKTMRSMMQTLGTEWGREKVSSMLWAGIGIRRAINSGREIVIFDDVRFETEREVIEDAGGVCVMLERPGFSYSDSHKSEMGLSGLPVFTNHELHEHTTVQEIVEFLRNRGAL